MDAPCPRCQEPCSMNKLNTFRPFCSHRCQQIDLGSWASEQYHITNDTLTLHNGVETQYTGNINWHEQIQYKE